MTTETAYRATARRTGLNQIVTCACCGKQLPKSNRCKICGGYTPARHRIVRDLTAEELNKIARRKALMNELLEGSR